MNGVIYARYSSDNQREESIDGQVRECLAYAEKKRDSDCWNVYWPRDDCENRQTSRFSADDQGQLQKKGFDVVLVWKLDRFARNRFDSAKHKVIKSATFSHLYSYKKAD